MKIQAAVVRETGKPFSIEPVELDAPRPHEILVRVVATGICHTDLVFKEGAVPYPLPAVLGHEGAGVVVRAGDQVTKVQAGDHVVLSFGSCGHCVNCLRQLPGYCSTFRACNLSGTRADGSCTHQDGALQMHGSFFSQSSFGTHALATERNVVKVSPGDPLELLGPLGCGIQTGAGAVLNSLAPEAGTSIAVFGCGAVGLSAIMAAKVSGCAIIIAVDVNEERLALARELGATHALNSKNVNVVDEVRKLTGGGTRYAVEATGHPEVMKTASEVPAAGGTVVLLGVLPMDAKFVFDRPTLMRGLTIKYVIEGDSNPDVFIPRLIDLHARGLFPFDKMIKSYEFERINEAVSDMKSGSTIKAVLRMP
jgi:aryl-alcohol dehydrogenase